MSINDVKINLLGHKNLMRAGSKNNEFYLCGLSSLAGMHVQFKVAGCLHSWSDILSIGYSEVRL